MSDTKHTPGPWYSMTTSRYSGLSIRHRTGDPKRPMIPIAIVNLRHAASEANCRLIVAAPDLLAMAIEARALLERGPDTTEAEREDVRRGLSDAITRATGSEQP